MSVKALLPSALALTLFASPSLAQGPGPAAFTPYPAGGAASPYATNEPPAPAADGAVAVPYRPQLDDWMTYRRPMSCYCPTGGDGPVRTELYLRAGPNFPFGDGVYGETLTTGWQIAAGARIMLFTPEQTSAWVFDLGLLNTWNQGSRRDIEARLDIIVPHPETGEGTRVALGFGDLPGVTIRDFNRTFVNVGVGKEWWLTGSAAECDGCRWRVGMDGGGRYGSASGQFHEIPHRTDVIGAAYVALHTDVEVPCGCCTFIGGVRAEYSYTWSDILQFWNKADVQDVTILLSAGVRF